MAHSLEFPFEAAFEEASDVTFDSLSFAGMYLEPCVVAVVRALITAVASDGVVAVAFEAAVVDESDAVALVDAWLTALN